MSTHRHEAADDTAAGNHKSDNDIHRQSTPDRYFSIKGIGLLACVRLMIGAAAQYFP
jgi:hypothetical protein